MENKNELSDIVLEKDDNKSMKTKRILIIVALLIVVFLIVIVVMRVANEPTQPKNSNVKLILPPNPTQKIVETNKEDDLFKQVPIVEEEDKKESFENMVKSLKAKEIQKQENIQPKEEEVVETVKVEETVKVVVPPKEVKPAKKPVKKQVKAKPVKKSSSNLAKNGIYIQVGATSRLTPDKKFLAKLSSKSYEYRLLPIDVKGTKVTKILVGPYSSNAKARSVLADIKSSINKDAFIYRVK